MLAPATTVGASIFSEGLVKDEVPVVLVVTPVDQTGDDGIGGRVSEHIGSETSESLCGEPGGGNDGHVTPVRVCLEHAVRRQDRAVLGTGHNLNDRFHALLVLVVRNLALDEQARMSRNGCVPDAGPVIVPRSENLLVGESGLDCGGVGHESSMHHQTTTCQQDFAISSNYLPGVVGVLVDVERSVWRRGSCC